MPIRPYRDGDEVAVADIYRHYILHTTVTFEEEPLAPQAMRERIQGYVNAGHPWLVFEDDTGAVQGYAYAGPYHHRAAYRHTLESSVYLRHGQQQKGLGRALYSALLDHLKHAGCHVVLGKIALPNPASEALHRAFGFTQAGQLHEVGFKFGQWIDIGIFEKRLG